MHCATLTDEFCTLQMGNAMVSLRRLTQYLVLEERSDEVQQLPRVGLEIQNGNFYWSEPPATKKLDSVKGAPGKGKKKSLLSVFGGLKLRKGPAKGTGPAKDSDKVADDAQTDKATDGSAAKPEDVAVTLGKTQDASKLPRKVAPGEASSSSSSSSAGSTPCNSFIDTILVCCTAGELYLHFDGHQMLQ